jgi:hypothetical protein
VHAFHRDRGVGTAYFLQGKKSTPQTGRGWLPEDNTAGVAGSGLPQLGCSEPGILAPAMRATEILVLPSEGSMATVTIPLGVLTMML